MGEAGGLIEVFDVRVAEAIVAFEGVRLEVGEWVNVDGHVSSRKF